MQVQSYTDNTALLESPTGSHHRQQTGKRPFEPVHGQAAGRRATQEGPQTHRPRFSTATKRKPNIFLTADDGGDLQPTRPSLKTPASWESPAFVWTMAHQKIMTKESAKAAPAGDKNFPFIAVQK